MVELRLITVKFDHRQGVRNFPNLTHQIVDICGKKYLHLTNDMLMILIENLKTTL